MAEAVALGASIVTLTEVIGFGGKALAKLRACKHAPPEVARIRTEVEKLARLLVSIKSFADGNSGTYIHDLLAEALKDAATRLEVLNHILRSPAFGIRCLNDANLARLTFLRYKTKLGNVEKDIKESIQQIGVRLSLVNA